MFAFHLWAMTVSQTPIFIQNWKKKKCEKNTIRNKEPKRSELNAAIVECRILFRWCDDIQHISRHERCKGNKQIWEVKGEQNQIKYPLNSVSWTNACIDGVQRTCAAVSNHISDCVRTYFSLKHVLCTNFCTIRKLDFIRNSVIHWLEHYLCMFPLRLVPTHIGERR